MRKIKKSRSGGSCLRRTWPSPKKTQKEGRLDGDGINNLGALPRGCCSHKVFIFGFHTFMTAAEPRGMKPSIRIKIIVYYDDTDIFVEIKPSPRIIIWQVRLFQNFSF
jgi:hypothetical protein